MCDIIWWGELDMWIFDQTITIDYVLTRILVVMVMVFGIFPLKQYMCAFVANKLGDWTARASGKLTINPLVHFDFLGAICMLFFTLGWPRSVPVNPVNFSKRKRDWFFTGITSPLVHICAGIIGGFLFAISRHFSVIMQTTFFNSFITFFIYLNVVCAAYDFLPIEPFKGLAIFQVFMSDNALKWYYAHYYIVSFVLCMLLIFGFFNGFINITQSIIYNFIIKITAF